LIDYKGYDGVIAVFGNNVQLINYSENKLMDEKIFSVIKKKWMNTSPQTWWGDSIDCRFHLVANIRKLRNQTVLDIGTNTGIIMSELDESNDIYGLDYKFDFMKECKKSNPSSKVLQGDMFNIPFHDNTFNSVLLSAMIEVPKNYEAKRRLIAEAHRVLSPNGKVFIMTPNRNHWCYQQSNIKVTLEQLRSLLEPFFEYKIYGWNPFPPKDVPSPILAKLPGMYNLLTWLSNREILFKISKSFYVEAVKK